MDRLRALSDAGVSLWLDDLSRGRLSTGGLEDLRHSMQVRGITTNPSIFASALSASQEYAEQVSDLARRGVGVDEAARLITAYDVRWACDVMRPVYDATDGVDGRVSIEVDPRLAFDAEGTIAEAKALNWLIDRPNLFVKIPATDAGLAAITEALAAGISVNVTLIFGLARYGQVIEAFFDGMERAKAVGHDLSKPASVASFFISRVDTEADRRLKAMGGERAQALQGKVAVANAQLAYQQFERAFSGQRWSSLAAAGAKPQRPLWASTSTKNPAYRDVLYVEDLIAPNTVNTMPESTLRAFANHGVVRADAIQSSYDQARGILNEMAALGISYDNVIAVLEQEGVDKFQSSWADLLKNLDAQLRHAVP